MTNAARARCIVECFWAGVREQDLRDLDRRVAAALAALAGEGPGVRYLGWLLVVDDEVALLLFDGPMGSVRRVAEQARVPFGRILRAVPGPWPPTVAAEKEVVS